MNMQIFLATDLSEGLGALLQFRIMLAMFSQAFHQTSGLHCWIASIFIITLQCFFTHIRIIKESTTIYAYLICWQHLRDWRHVLNTCSYTLPADQSFLTIRHPNGHNAADKMPIHCPMSTVVPPHSPLPTAHKGESHTRQWTLSSALSAGMHKHMFFILATKCKLLRVLMSSSTSPTSNFCNFCNFCNIFLVFWSLGKTTLFPHSVVIFWLLMLCI